MSVRREWYNTNHSIRTNNKHMLLIKTKSHKPLNTT